MHHRLRHPHLGEKQPHLKLGALAGLALHRKFAAHQRDQQLGDGQAEADAVVLAQRVAAFERLEDALQLRLGDADAAVADLEGGRLAGIADTQADDALLGVAHGIAEQVDQYLADAFLVAAYHRRHPPLQLEVKAQALLFGLRAEHPLQLLEELREGDFAGLQIELADLDLGHVEQAVDQRQQVRAAAQNGRQGVLLLRRGGGIALQNLGVAEHAVERRAQLVGQAGDVATLGRVGGFGGFLGFLQLLVGALVRFDFLHQ